jgi:CheY-like chemotaxis protein
VLVEAAKICANDIAQRKINLVQKHEAGRASLNADPARLQQVFWNLLANAAKFTPEGGTISVRTSTDNDGSAFRVDFSDTGVGIEPQKLDRIFDAFEQGEQNSSAGLGLGLAICKALVDLHGGRIEAKSAGPGAGSCFTITLPLSVSAPAAAGEAPLVEPPESGALRILLVEDHADTAETLHRLLSRRGYEVRTAASVADAMRVADTFVFDVLVSDIGLPDGRGTELLGRLQRQIDRPIRAVAMSGFGMEDDIERSRQAGFADHLTKPVDFGELERAISHLAVDFTLPLPR